MLYRGLRSLGFWAIDWQVCGECVVGSHLGIRDGDEVVVGHLPTQVEMRWEGLMVVMVGVAQAKYMVLRVSW